MPRNIRGQAGIGIREPAGPLLRKSRTLARLPSPTPAAGCAPTTVSRSIVMPPSHRHPTRRKIRSCPLRTGMRKPIRVSPAGEPHPATGRRSGKDHPLVREFQAPSPPCSKSNPSPTHRSRMKSPRMTGAHVGPRPDAHDRFGPDAPAPTSMSNPITPPMRSACGNPHVLDCIAVPFGTGLVVEAYAPSPICAKPLPGCGRRRPHHPPPGPKDRRSCERRRRLPIRAAP